MELGWENAKGSMHVISDLISWETFNKLNKSITYFFNFLRDTNDYINNFAPK